MIMAEVIDYPWPLFPTGVYWSLRDDGAPARCKECGGWDPLSKLVLTQTPIGDRAVFHLACLEDDWVAGAKNLGTFPK
jgi:hypothetical protein